MAASPDQTLQYLGWLFALLELMFGAYVIYLNPGSRANRLAALFMLVLAATTFGTASLAGAAFSLTARSYALLLAALFPLHNPIQLLVILAIFRPAGFDRKSLWKLAIPALWVISLLPVALTLIDYRFGTALWFSGLPETHSAGYLPFTVYTRGLLYPLVYILSFAICGLAILLYLSYKARLDRSLEPAKKRAALGLLAATAAATLFFAVQRGGTFAAVLAVSATLLYLAGYAYVTFQEALSEQRERAGSLKWRLTGLALIISIPLIAGMTVFLAEQARQGLAEAAYKTLSTANGSVSDGTALWLEFNASALKTLVKSSDVVSMNSLWQRPLIKEMAATYPHMYLVSTTDVNGINKTRSDDLAPLSYKDRFWFQNALGGAPITYETLIGMTSNRPALVISMPIKKADGRVVGVGMFATELDEIYKLVKDIQLGEGGSIFIIDHRNIMITHTDVRAPLLANMSGNPAVKALRKGITGAFSYADNKGERVQAYVSLLPNDWGVIAQQTEAGLFRPIREFQQLAFTILVICAALMALLAWYSIRQALRPVDDLTETATAISQGDLTRQAQADSQDELGLLARAFNQMTGQLRELIGGLETRVAERTQALERRALQFQVTAEVAREASAIREPGMMMQDVVNLISERFGFDHAGIFLLERSEAAEIPAAGKPQTGYAVLRAASSEGGQRMLGRSHRLRVGRQGIVGYAAATGQPRIALDVGSDAVFFDNPDLPLTRSEIALPLMVRNRVIGVLDVQSNRPSAFSDEDVSILQILADQIALAIENARLLTESQQALRELESLYGMQIRQGWNRRLANQGLVFTFDSQGVERSRVSPDNQGDFNESTDLAETEVLAPIELRGQRIGALRLRRAAERGGWTEAERELIQQTASQLALSLENARLLEEVRSQANQEELINQIVARTESSLHLETVMKTAVTEIGRLMRLSRVELRLGERLNGEGGDGHEH